MGSPLVVEVGNPWRYEAPARRPAGLAAQAAKAPVRLACGGADLRQDRTQVAKKQRWVLAHGKMAEPFHHRQLGALDPRREFARIGRATGIVVLAGQQIERAGLRIDRAQPAPHVAILRIKVKVAFEHTRAALHIMPDRLPTLARRDRGGNQPGDHGAADLPAMHVRSVQPVEVVVGLRVRGRLKADQRAKALRVLERQIEDDPAPDGTAHTNRPLEPQGVDDRPHRVEVGARGKTVFALLPTRWRRGLAVPGQIEGDDAKLGREGLVVHQAAKLPAVGTRRVQAQERNAASRLLEVEAMEFATDLKGEVAAEGGFELWGSHCCYRLSGAPAARGKANSSLK